MRTLNDALDRAKSLRDFRESNRGRFEKSEDYQDVVLLADEVERHRALQDRSEVAYWDAHLGKVVDDMAARIDADDLNGACDIFDAVINNGFGDEMFESARPGELKKFWKDMRGLIIGMRKASSR